MQTQPSTTGQGKIDVQPPSLGLDVQRTAQLVNTTYIIIGWVLQEGVLLSATVIVVGLIMMALSPDKFGPQRMIGWQTGSISTVPIPIITCNVRSPTR